jgi:hypothetical protein
MKIETKFDVGDRVYIIDNDEFTYTKVNRIKILDTEEETSIDYMVIVGSGIKWIPENKVWSSKQDFVKSF